MVTDDPAGAGFAVAPEAGAALWFLGERVTVKVSGEETGGTFSVIEDLVPTGGEPPPHVHSREDETFYVLEGALSVTCGERTFEAPAGSFVRLPRNVTHSWRVISSVPARLLGFYTPGGFERFFQAGGVPALSSGPPPPLDGPPDLPRILALAAEFGLTVVLPGAAS